ncbi:MAG TPA: hypothetical protein VGP93_13935, partial [Polyangiaceae bacterium]|nr:hypothetical protein [Polyangiaceae bacterium]
FTAGTLLLWYGRDAAQAVLPGVLAGFVPLFLALCATHFGRMCNDEVCRSWCLAASALGGALAALVVVGYGGRRQRSLRFWLLSSALALLTGALGSTCVGLAGVICVALGYGFALGCIFLGSRFTKAKT